MATASIAVVMPTKLTTGHAETNAPIPPSPELPITADWLREAWGFEKAEWSKIAYENGHGSMVKVNDDCWHYEDDNFEWPHDLHTRQQFCDLAKALGIPRKDGAK